MKGVKRGIHVIKIEPDVYRISIKNAGTTQTETLIDHKSVALAQTCVAVWTERAAKGNERRTGLALRETAIQFVSEGVCRCDGGDTCQHDYCRNAGAAGTR